MKRCPRCLKTKSHDQFYSSKGKLAGWCKACDRERSAAYYAANREKQKAAHRVWVQANRQRVAAHRVKSTYGISREEYERLLAQPCAICGDAEAPRIDHDHATGAIRGTLCDACNKAIGFMKDDAERLTRAAQYLKDPIFRETYDRVPA